MADDSTTLLNDLKAICQTARELVGQLMDLANSDGTGHQWSSQVTRCQSKIADTMKRYKCLIFELEILIEEEDRCVVAI
jgi:hypothetical protein